MAPPFAALDHCATPLHNSGMQFQRGDYSILVVDDTASARYATARSLRAAGYHTVEAAAGAQALELAPFVSAVVLDVHLPDLHGLEVCRLIRARPATANLPVIHVSAVYVSQQEQAARPRRGRRPLFRRTGGRCDAHDHSRRIARTR